MYEPLLPYHPKLIARLLRKMGDERLRTIRFQDFQMHPAPVIAPGGIIRELIANEKARSKVNG